ncbi:MAG TPA: hypothetical protein VNS34_17245 [Rhizobiaceae bacterium]|nr:hypothetical protein [Rhizobiaceae bacterium]
MVRWTPAILQVSLSLMAADAFFFGSVTARAADASAQFEVDDLDPDESEVDTENIFGFTDGTDVNEQGEREVSLTGFGGFVRQKEEEADPSRYRAWEAEAEFEYGITNNLTLGFGAAFSYHSIENVEDMDDVNGGGFNGLSAEMKYRILSRENSPVGLAFSIEPEWTRFEDDSGERADGFELNTNLMLDRELVAEKLYGAINFRYAPEWTDGDDGTEKESALEASGALAWQVTPGFFLGGELRYLAGYEGLTFDEFEGSAFYVGPSVYAQLTRAAFLKVAYSYQVAGSSDESPGDSLDLVGHDRQQFLLKFGVEF